MVFSVRPGTLIPKESGRDHNGSKPFMAQLPQFWPSESLGMIDNIRISTNCDDEGMTSTHTSSRCGSPPIPIAVKLTASKAHGRLLRISSVEKGKTQLSLIYFFHRSDRNRAVYVYHDQRRERRTDEAFKKTWRTKSAACLRVKLTLNILFSFQCSHYFLWSLVRTVVHWCESWWLFSLCFIFYIVHLDSLVGLSLL